MRPKTVVPDLSKQGKIPSTSINRKIITDPLHNIRKQYQDKLQKME